jgi:hypothetical protein
MSHYAANRLWRDVVMERVGPSQDTRGLPISDSRLARSNGPLPAAGLPPPALPLYLTCMLVDVASHPPRVEQLPC